MHNRWHPEIEPEVVVRPGEEVTLRCLDGLNGQLPRGSAHDDVGRVDHAVPHALSGPVYVEGAEPGSVLRVDLLAFEPDGYGFTAIFPGFGFLADLFPDPYLLSWDVGHDFATSPGLPGVEIPPAIFPGVIGVAPSHELMAGIRRREDDLRARGGAVVDDHPGAAVPAHAKDGLRTIPPREIGGNLDVRQLVAGSSIYLPVHVPGALLSVGDVHYAQGDGEVNGTGLEIAAAVTLRATPMPRPAWAPRFPWFETPPEPPRRHIAFTGMPVTGEGRNESMDFELAARNALLAALDWLEGRGLTRQAAYCLASVAVDLRLSEVVDVPNPVVSALLPLDIFRE